MFLTIQFSMSPPALNARPAPVRMTMSKSLSSAPSTRNWVSSYSISSVKTLSFSGRLSVTVRIRSFRLKIIVS